MSTYSVPISVKGIVFDNDKVWLRKNERNEWELPGGKLDEGEQPEQTVTRELQEELGFEVDMTSIVQSHLYTIKLSEDESRGVLVVSYLCRLLGKPGDFETEGEAGVAQFKDFPIEAVSDLNMPEFYKVAIEAAWKRFSSKN
ncbi:MAG: NUDIX hydrolase [Gammaproteobacteria bacterium]|nr:NUDIX hydrolase [Gammaproteobacteria bacterium]